MGNIKDAVADTTTKKNRASALATHYANMASGYGFTVPQAENLCNLARSVYIAKKAGNDKAAAKVKLGDPFFTAHEKTLDKGVTVRFEVGGVVIEKTLTAKWTRDFVVSDAALDVEVK